MCIRDSGAHGGLVLRDDALHGPAALGDVALQPPDEPDVGIRVDVDLHVEEFPELRLGEDEDAVHEDDLSWLDAAGLGRAAVELEVVDRRLDDHSLLERLEMAHEQLALERVRMVEILPVEDVLRQIHEVPVVRVVGEDRDALFSHAFDDRIRDRRLARARPSREPDEERRHLKASSISFAVPASEPFGSSLRYSERCFFMSGILLRFTYDMPRR